ncbi:YggS family pyridoxal phosphate-dependent enzyme [Acidisarcina polymorpha]
MSNFRDNLGRVEEKIAAACRRAGRPRGEVALMAVSKTHPASAIREAIEAGVALFGENRVQEFQQKSAELADAKIAVRLIGQLQSNKSAKAAEIFSGVDSLDSIRLAQRLDEAAKRLGRTLPVLLEIKLSREESKTGLEPESLELVRLLERLPEFANLRLGGLMTVPPWSEDPECARPYFVQLRHLRDQLAARWTGLDFSELSMGMSGDFAVAIEEGSTCIRVGTALFGKRPYPAKPEEP